MNCLRRLLVRTAILLFTAFPVHDVSAESSPKRNTGSRNDWIMDQLRQNHAFDLGEYCNNVSTSTKSGVDCDSLSNVELSQTLGAFVAENPNAEIIAIKNVTLTGRVYITNKIIKPSLIFDHVHFEHGIAFDGSAFDHELSFFNSEIDEFFFIHISNISQSLNIIDCNVNTSLQVHSTQVGDSVRLLNSTLKESPYLLDLNVKNSMQIVRTTSTSNEFRLLRSTVGSFLDFSDSHFGSIDLAGTHVSFVLGDQNVVIERDLLMSAFTAAGVVNLGGIKVGGSLDLSRSHILGALEVNKNASIDGSFSAYGAQVEGDIDISGINVSRDIDMTNVKVGGDLLMMNIQSKSTSRFELGQIHGVFNISGSTFQKQLEASQLEVQHNLYIQNASISEGMDLKDANLLGSLILYGSKLNTLNLQGARILRALRMDSGPANSPQWAGGAELNLTNSSIGSIEEVSPNNKSWPLKIAFQGFSVNTIIEASQYNWADLLNRDPVFSRQPYHMIADAFAKRGDTDASNFLDVAARQREKSDNWAKGDCNKPLHLLTNSLCWSSVELFTSEKLIGYGIGQGTLRILPWSLLVTMIGAAVIANSRADHHGWVWCIGASLSKLFPFTSYSKEYERFFDDRNRHRFGTLHSVYFAIHTTAGWLLVGIVAAAVAGLTQGR